MRANKGTLRIYRAAGRWGFPPGAALLFLVLVWPCFVFSSVSVGAQSRDYFPDQIRPSPTPDPTISPTPPPKPTQPPPPTPTPSLTPTPSPTPSPSPTAFVTGPPEVDLLDPLPDSQVHNCLLPVQIGTSFTEYVTQLQTSDFDLLFVLDRSGSMVYNDPADKTREAALDLLNTLPTTKDILCGVEIFGGGEIVQHLTLDRDAVRAAIEGLGDRDLGTDIAGAILTADEEFIDNGRPQYAKVIVLVSDGGEYSQEALKEADRSGAQIHTFFLGEYSADGEAMMRDLASRTGGVYYKVTDLTILPNLFSYAVNRHLNRVAQVQVVSSYNPDVVVRAYRDNNDYNLWWADDVPFAGDTFLTIRAITNEIPARTTEIQTVVHGYTAEDLIPELEITDSPDGKVISGTTIPLSGQAWVHYKDTVVQGGSGLPVSPGSALQLAQADQVTTIPGPCESVLISRVELRSNATPGKVYSVIPDNKQWSFPEAPLRAGPGQVTLLNVRAIAVGNPGPVAEKTIEVTEPLPCRPIANLANSVREPDWEPFSHIPPFDAINLSDVGNGLDYSVPGPVQAGYFGFYQERDEVCSTPEGLDALRVSLDPHRDGTAPLPDCRVRIFKSDNTRSFFCRVNELNGRQLPAALDVPYISDGDSGLRIAVDLLAFNQRNSGGWTLLSPLAPESTWDFPTCSSIGSVSAASFEGEYGFDTSGSSLAPVGDVNGDGYADFLVGARDSSKFAQDAGKVYLILGKAGGWSRWTDTWFTQPSFVGEEAQDSLGKSLAGVGDVNGDGYDDFILAAPDNNEGGTGAGKVYLFLGRSDMWGMEQSVSTADATFIGEAAGDHLGNAVAGVGDVNGDGFDDFVLSAPYHTDGFVSSGKVYLFLGKSTGWYPGASVATADASFIGVNTNDYAGASVAGAGDVNNDGYADFLIGAIGSDTGGQDAGETYLEFGRSRGWVKDFPLDGSPASFVGEAAGDKSGTSVAGAGDVNGDGYDDFLIGAPFSARSGKDAGQAYLFLGKASGWSLHTSVATADASFLGATNLGQAGFCVGKAGDITGDGLDDFLIGAIHADVGPLNAGAVYLVPGALQGWHRDTSLASIPYSFHGENTGDLLGFRACGVGDVNKDGYDDFIAGAPGNSDGGTDAGHTYLVLGGPTGPQLAPSLADVVPPPTEGSNFQQALADLNESSWEAYRQIPPYQEANLTDTTDGLDFQAGQSFTMGYFGFYQTRDSFAALPAGLHYLRVHLKQERVAGHLLPDIRVRVFTVDNSVSYYARYTEAAGGTMPTVVDVPFVSDGVWPFRVAVDLMSLDTRMYGGWTVTGIEFDP